MNQERSSQTQQDLLRSRLEILRERFRARAAEDLEDMTQALARGDRLMIRERAHRLAGVAATFGYPDVGEAAKSLEDLIEQDAIPEDVGGAAHRLFVLLRRAGLTPKRRKARDP